MFLFQFQRKWRQTWLYNPASRLDLILCRSAAHVGLETPRIQKPSSLRISSGGDWGSNSSIQNSSDLTTVEVNYNFQLAKYCHFIENKTPQAPGNKKSWKRERIIYSHPKTTALLEIQGLTKLIWERGNNVETARAWFWNLLENEKWHQKMNFERS